ncbi:uncharacterized protein BP5553_06046 [Venustampulla echinocandica]|uniref:Sodium/calcium exchanger membrane region domain-containing protein n=1 Tax=Venustampulla echinocandica TaxID=2656787 RepID=A0A370TMF2_9HELO|nr:uncharacterized protein BP5553_06046 [Venustampulla echinocandica]RDL36694.1 hypothetical protein BP5553_06046 [Venustampulla echinocandica]
MQPAPPNAVSTRYRRQKFSFRAFYITVVLISGFAVCSIIAAQTTRYIRGPGYEAIYRRTLEGNDVGPLLERGKECRYVHDANDQCAFIKANCPDEEAGLFSYLSLYYCNLSTAKPLAFMILALWLALLFTMIGIAASDFFCINLSTIANILGMSESMAGVTFLAFGNGSPDVFSTFAAMNSNSGSLAVGELIGAAGFITAVVAGSMALVREFKVGKKTFVRDVGFFIVAASFSMIFLADGALHLWECCVMIGFYIFYVAIVVIWHWYLNRQRLRREREAASRGHYLAMMNDELEAEQDNFYDEDAPAGQRRYRDSEDFGALERGSSPAQASELSADSDEDTDAGLHLAAEMASSMRVTRPRGVRRNTITPIRPSLVGALEFRSVLSSLQKSRGSHALPNIRRYSDDPITANTGQQYGLSESETVPYSDSVSSHFVSPTEDPNDSYLAAPVSRARSVSLNDAGGAITKGHAVLAATNIPNIGIVAATPTRVQQLDPPAPGGVATSTNMSIPPSPTISLTPPASVSGSRDISPVRSTERRKHDSLAPPGEGFPGARHLHVDFGKKRQSSPDSNQYSPRDKSRGSQLPRLSIPGPLSTDSSGLHAPSPSIQFPEYTDSPLPLTSQSSRPPSIILPEAEYAPESVYTDQELESGARPIKWWPYRFLPSPYVLRSTLFPTLCTWQDKSIWDKFISIVSAPSIFLLAITLPVVESEPQQEDIDEPVLGEQEPLSRKNRNMTPLLIPDSPSSEAEPEWLQYRRATESHVHPPHPRHDPSHPGHGAAEVAVSTEDMHRHSHLTPTSPRQRSMPPSPRRLDEAPPYLPPNDWNRWLIAVQIFTAPLFTVLIVWANTDDSDLGHLVRLVLYSLLVSLIAFAILILTTTPYNPPKYRFLLCFLGFVVSIAWISTIANEVVGVLKAFGVIFGISDAILGLTIFAVGNSLGDLVADITVARLGYPVMALSACFGGPMLNILLGIGVSGLYITIREANHKHTKHPGKEIKYKPYHIEVSRTLMVSGFILLVTLVGLLIAVPVNNWVMSRRIGWGLIALWIVGTVLNLGIEISGVGSTS